MKTNWKTTLIGALTGAGLIVLDLLKTGTTDLKTIAIAAGISILGAFAHDAGNVPK